MNRLVERLRDLLSIILIYSRALKEHLSKSADANNTDIHAALKRAPLLERRVHRDARAEDGAGCLKGVALGNLENLNIFITNCLLLHR